MEIVAVFALVGWLGHGIVSNIMQSNHDVKSWEKCRFDKDVYKSGLLGFIAHPSYQKLSQSERNKKVAELGKEGMINQDPNLSCYESIRSLNFVGCYYHQVINNYELLSRYESALAIPAEEYNEINSYYLDVKKDTYLMNDQMNTEIKVPANVRFASCRPEIDGYETWITSVIFIKE